MTKELANKIYDVLVSLGGADETMRSSFVYHHCQIDYKCAEWRFMGKLGYGGKYWSEDNRVTCYSEHETEERKELIAEMNKALGMIILKEGDEQ